MGREGKGQEDSSFSEEKEAKRLLSVWSGPDGWIEGTRQADEVFLLLFVHKKKAFFFAPATVAVDPCDMGQDFGA